MHPFLTHMLYCIIMCFFHFLNFEERKRMKNIRIWLLCYDHIHNICFVHSRNFASLIVSGIFKSKVSNTFACFFRDEFDTLYNAINNLKDTQQLRR